MIFPHDVNKRIAEKNKVAGDNKIQLCITLFVLGNFFGFMFFDWVNLSFFGAGMWLTILMTVGVNIAVGIFVFRFFIFDENAKIKEFNSAEGDSFARFLKIRKDVDHTLHTQKGKVMASEFMNGSVAFTVEFKFGGNDNKTAMATRGVFQQLFQIAHSNGLETRTIIQNEDFSKSKEFNKYVAGVNRVKLPKLRNALIQLHEAVMSKHNDSSHVNCVYLTVRSLSNYQRADLELILQNYIKVFSSNVTAFRSIRFLSTEEMMNYFTEFYGIGAIDLSTMQAMELSKDLDNSFADAVSVISLTASDGSVYTTSTCNQIFKLGESKIND